MVPVSTSMKILSFLIILAHSRVVKKSLNFANCLSKPCIYSLFLKTEFSSPEKKIKTQGVSSFCKLSYISFRFIVVGIPFSLDSETFSPKRVSEDFKKTFLVLELLVIVKLHMFISLLDIQTQQLMTQTPRVYSTLQENFGSADQLY